MHAIEVFAFAVGVLCLVLIAVFSLRGPRARPGVGRGGPIIPLGHGRHDADDNGDGDFGDGG